MLRGLKALEIAKPPPPSDGGTLYSSQFDAAGWVWQHELARQRDQLPDVLPEVDDVWHLSYLQSTGGGAQSFKILMRGLESHSYKHVEQTLPACVVLHASALKRPPKPPANYRDSRDRARPTLPGGAVAVAHCTDPHDSSGGPRMSDAIKRVLMLGAMARGGRCRKLILGPHSGAAGHSVFRLEYGGCGGGGVNDLVKFIESVLGIENHSMDGWMEGGRHPNWTMEFRSMKAAEFQAAREAGKSVWDM